MAQAISFSLFGYGAEKHKDCYAFSSYIRGLHLNILMRDIIFPQWTVVVVLDKDTYLSPYKAYFDYMVDHGKIIIEVVDNGPLCYMMLRRMMPLFDERFDRVICRDTDSLLTYRERQAVEYWVRTGRVAHGITDSVSHNVTFLGGLCGFQSKEFREMMGVNSFEELVALDTRKSIDWNMKGADQHFLAKFVLPKVANSLVEHYILGLPQSFRGECYNFVQDMPIEDVPVERKDSNDLIVHMGQAGVIVDPVLRYFDANLSSESKSLYLTIESGYKEIFYWRM